MRSIGNILFFIVLILVSNSCDKTSKAIRTSNAPVLAEVKGVKLYQDELELKGAFSSASNAEDSIFVINNYVQNWIKEQLMLSVAEKSLPDDIDLDLLVQDYRESLLLYNYEKLVISQQLDTTITAAQIKDYYDKNGKSFHLSEPIVRCRFAKVPLKTSGLEKFYANWKANKIESITSYLDQNAQLAMLSEETWYTVDEILSLLPDKVNSKDLKTKKDIQIADETNENFVKILEYVDNSEDPPLSYVSSNIKKILLHNRKKALLIKLKDDLYQKEINSSNVRIY